ncbi:hypothetical protein [Parendozoicomonas sp. Alg238-R29]|uniref:hypothetical protein n=1 Tax=Parendozoicomonas sp. Alg238-R29 TaxID=2993446 RepID=UPI00248EAB4C|nr:hypothetical protein [Parendozoicomonas sp. Alg238-R29]
MKIWYVVPLVSLLLVGCELDKDKISIEKVGSKTYLINQEQSKAFVIYGEKLVRLKEDIPAPLKIGQTLKYKTLISSKKLDVDTKIKFMGSKALYNMHIKPVIELIDKSGNITKDKTNLEWFNSKKKDYDSYNAITVQLKDSDGFKLAEESLRISRGFINVLGEGSEIESFMYEGSFSVDPEIVQFASYLEITWNIK